MNRKERRRKERVINLIRSLRGKQSLTPREKKLLSDLIGVLNNL
jgi:hypothetical protein